jgi:hypothetical protein
MGDKSAPSSGLHARKKQVSKTSRERSAVFRAIKVAIQQIALHDPELAEILKSEIKTGRIVSYIRKGK